MAEKSQDIVLEFGNGLVDLIYGFYAVNQNLLKFIKRSHIIGKYITITFFRCQGVERLIELLSNKTKVANLNTQHDIAKIFLAIVDILDNLKKGHDTLKEEDELDDDEGFFVPVKNVWIVDKLRSDLTIKDMQLSEKDVQLSEKDIQLSEKDIQLSEKDIQLSETNKKIHDERDIFEKQLQEKDAKLIEKDKYIQQLLQKIKDLQNNH